MKTRIALMILPILSILTAPVMASDYNRNDQRIDRIEHRLDRQKWRIKQGVRSGELSRHETKRLRKQHRRIVKMKHRFLHDGYLNRHERRKLERKLNAASDRIYRLKHNNKQRNYRYGGYYRHHS